MDWLICISPRSPERMQEIATELKRTASEIGLPLTYITSAKPSVRLKHYEEWIKKGYHGEMGYLAREDRLARRRDLNLILPGVQSIVMVGLVYWPGRSGFPQSHNVKDAVNGGDTGIVSCYAWGEDYHAIMQSKLHTLGSWLHERSGGLARYYVDTGPIFERDMAERAGMGFVGKNSLLINPRLGSGFFIGTLLTTIKLPIDGEEAPKPGRGKPGCGKCTKCKVACPTDAIVEDRVIGARRCISYLTIELKGRFQ